MRCTLSLILLLFGSSAFADTWTPPSKRTYEAADHQTRLTVIPRDLTSALAYFQDKVDGREPAGAPAGSRATSATAILERRDASGHWATSWAKPLANEVAPVDVLVANGGRSVVTLDNWHSMGYGSRAIVIYDAQGNVVRALALEDIFPKWFVAAQPHSVSSIWWRTRPRISDDGTVAIIPIKLPTDNRQSGDGPTIDLHIRLSDGAPQGLNEQPWQAGLVQAAATARQMCRDEREDTAKWNSPILAPSAWVEPAWHEYLREIVYRSAPKWTEDSLPVLGTTVLRPSSAKDFQPSVTWLKEALTEQTDTPGDDVRAIASPDYERLTQEIERLAPKISARRLSGVELVIVVDAAHAARVRAALSRSGANLRIVNPLERFPQRPERMRKTEAAELAVCQVPHP